MHHLPLGQISHLIKRLIFILTILTATTAWCQVTITGKVISKEDKSPLPGVNVVIKGTQSGTSTTSDGTFSLIVTDTNSILVFSFVGLATQEFQLNGQNEILVKMKLDCIRDYWDVQKIGIYASSGLINTPIGGQFDFAFPAYFGKGSLIAGIGYQTNADNKEFLNGKIELKHFIWACNFDMDANWYYRNVHYKNKFNSRAYSFETNLDFNGLMFISGYSNLKLNQLETNDRQTLSGAVIGIGIWIGQLRLLVSGKTAIYKDRQEYMGQITRDSRHLNLFLKFYKLDSFTELSLGIGTEFGYLFKRQKG